jgi:hypothetical protein
MRSSDSGCRCCQVRHLRTLTDWGTGKVWTFQYLKFNICRLYFQEYFVRFPGPYDTFV